jgi:hypothetical protein
MSIFQQRGDTGAARFTPTTAATKCGVDSSDDHVPHQQPGSGGGGGGGGHLSLLQPVEDTLRDRLISTACRCTCAARSGLSAAIDLEGLLLGENGLWSLVPYGNIMADRKLIDDADTAARRMWLASRAATKIVRNQLAKSLERAVHAGASAVVENALSLQVWKKRAGCRCLAGRRQT